MITPLASSPFPSLLSAGILMIADIKPRYAAVIEIILHEGAEIRRLEDSSTVVVSPAANTLYCAYYGTDVATNEWDPCDQSVAAAYMPLRYALLNSWPLRDGGAFLVQRSPSHERIWRNVVSDDPETRVVTMDRRDPIAVASAVATLLREAGVPANELSRCVEAVRDQISTIN